MNTRFKKGQIPWIKGKHHTAETRKKISMIKKLEIDNKGRFKKGHKVSEKIKKSSK